MERALKVEHFNKLKDAFSTSSAVIVVSFKAMNAESVAKLRFVLRKVGIGAMVSKDTVVRMVCRGSNVPEDFTALFTGSNMIFYSESDDYVAFLKTLSKLLEGFSSQLSIKGALLVSVNQYLGCAEIDAYVKMPSVDELRSELVGLFQSMAGGEFVDALEWTQREFVRCLEFIGDKE